MSKLWLVEIHEDDFEYDCFASAVVWGDTPEEAEQTIRAAGDLPWDSGERIDLPRKERTRLTVKPIPTSGVVLQYWHVG